MEQLAGLSRRERTSRRRLSTSITCPSMTPRRGCPECSTGKRRPRSLVPLGLGCGGVELILGPVSESLWGGPSDRCRGLPLRCTPACGDAAGCLDAGQRAGVSPADRRLAGSGRVGSCARAAWGVASPAFGSGEGRGGGHAWPGAGVGRWAGRAAERMGGWFAAGAVGVVGGDGGGGRWGGGVVCGVGGGLRRRGGLVIVRRLTGS